ncbi:MAG: anti-sigma factor family protein [Bryobacteraceae bacterium]
MKCSDLEALICDYIDGTVREAEKATVELHLSGCESCRQMVADGRAALAFMERAADVEVPPTLVNKILFEVRAGGLAPVRVSKRRWLGRWLEPVLQPKFAMGMAMTILSFAMLGRMAGVPIRPLKPSDLQPAKVWATVEDRAWHSWQKARKYYESLRLVYEIRETLSDLNEAADNSRAQKPEAGTAANPGTNPEKQVDQPTEKRPQAEK